jgi:hypothetical protein
MDENNLTPGQDQQQPQSTPTDVQPQEQQKNFGQEVVSTAYKYEGWKMKINVIIYLVFATIIFLGGVLFSFVFHTFIILMMAMFPVIILLPLAWYTWRRGKVLSKEGKFSPPWKID